ncbi:MAG: nitroreductase family protein, partial [Actinomycetota bacterium]|nr:nitroreductase family protein [Actinomycetota bacterium]
MDLLEAMRTAFSCREFTDDPVTDDQLHRILDAARFAPSGGNRQGGHVVVVRDPGVRRRLGELCRPSLRVYAAQSDAGETPFSTVHPTAIDLDEARATPTNLLPLFEHLDQVHRILAAARFAPSGGNRQGGHVVVVRDPGVRRRLGELCRPSLRVYAAQSDAGETPFSTIHPTAIDLDEARATPTNLLPLFEHLDQV